MAASAASLKPHPLQPLADELKQIDCDINALKAAIQALGTALGGGNSVSVTVTPPRTTTAMIGRITVGTTYTLIRPANAARLSVSIVNGGASSVWLGIDKQVTGDTGNNPGYELLAQATWDDDKYTGDIYGIVDAGTVIVSYWEE